MKLTLTLLQIIISFAELCSGLKPLPIMIELVIPSPLNDKIVFKMYYQTEKVVVNMMLGNRQNNCYEIYAGDKPYKINEF